ncbi:hypothetical protein CORC01_07362 [Colletotrichum orchidophilum]|uniref:Uncharacterized protein n=1 Tax=Colletotrichum orchidophilum TaxID=1209926 RepID=A0A1G4B7B9_9PEZI|nr:uncharacterized protein CORC01_07362 [Colletotrichum orchidophilum]OHE97307.1 hypothetical protein CORC01_07362 [Colletotrichum orchidophilum]
MDHRAGPMRNGKKDIPTHEPFSGTDFTGSPQLLARLARLCYALLLLQASPPLRPLGHSYLQRDPVDLQE